jgi:hypothetical protein
VAFSAIIKHFEARFSRAFWFTLPPPPSIVANLPVEANPNGYSFHHFNQVEDTIDIVGNIHVFDRGKGRHRIRSASQLARQFRPRNVAVLLSVIGI